MDMIRIFFETNPHFIYSGIVTGMFLSALFPVSFFFYGDYVFFPAAVFAQSGFIHIIPMYIATICWVYAGDVVSFFLGRYFGDSIFRKDAKYLNLELLVKGERFFKRYGKFAIIFSKGVPVAPGITPFIAGINKVSLWMFLVYDLLATAVIFIVIYWVLYGWVGMVRSFFGW